MTNFSLCHDVFGVVKMSLDVGKGLIGSSVVARILQLKNLDKQEGHDGPGSLTLIIQCTAMQNTSRQLF